MSDEINYNISCEIINRKFSMTAKEYGNKCIVRDAPVKITLHATDMSIEQGSSIDIIAGGAKPVVNFMGKYPEKLKLTVKLYKNLSEFGIYKQFNLGCLLSIQSRVGFLEECEYIVDGYSSNREYRNIDVIELTLDLVKYYGVE